MGYQEYLLPKWNAKHGHEVHIVTSDRYTPVADYNNTWGRFLGPRKCGIGETVTTDDLTIHRLGCSWEIKSRPWLKGLNPKLLELRPDGIFCHASASFTAYRIALNATQLRVPIAMDNHLAYVSFKKGPYRWILYDVLGLMSRQLIKTNIFRFYGVTPECCEILEREQRIPVELIEYLPLGVDTDLFQPLPQLGVLFRTKYSIPPDAIVVMQTGKLSRDKGADWLALAMSQIMLVDNRSWLVYVGGGPSFEVEELRSILNKNNLLDRSRFIDFLSADDLSSAYSAADICVYPAATSLSCLEAAACECAVIMSDLPISRDRSESGVGICYKTGDIDDLKTSIVKLIENREERISLGKNARIKIVEKYSYDRIAYRVEESFQEAISRFIEKC